MTQTMYVLQREDGKYYWVGHNSSQWDYKDGFENAHLFKSERGAKSRIGYGCAGMKCEINEVLVTIDL